MPRSTIHNYHPGIRPNTAWAYKLVNSLIVSESTRSSTNAAGIELRGVSRQLRFFIEQYRQGRRETTELVSVDSLNTRKHVSLEAERINEAVGLVSQKVDHLAALEGAKMDERARERLLASLKYPGFNQRRNQIDAAYGDTLEWIFVGDNDEESNDDSGSDEYGDSDEDDDSNSDESGEENEEGQSDQDHYSDHNSVADEQHGFRHEVNTGASGSDGEASRSAGSDSEFTDSQEEANSDHEAFWKIKWDSFSNWLSSTDVIYWISGKPGSGKTTVVKYILADKRTKKYLDIWNPGCAIVSHYFWLPGSPMQRNMDGLLCSLLYQLLEKNSNALVEVMSFVSDSKSSHTDWSNAELHSAVLRALDSYKNGVCFFLDGIDEIKPEDETKDGIPEFLDWTIELSQRSKIKLCLASRPDPHIIETRLSKYPRLRVQDLNYQDLVAYAKWRVKIPEEVISDQKRDLIHSLADKAEGVFLWLILATKSVNEGFRNDDGVETLQERIDRLPQGLDNLYEDMWARAGTGSPSEYRQTAALYFKLLLSLETAGMQGINTFQVMLATTCLADSVLHALADPSKLVREDEMLQQCREVEKKLKIYCVGLIQTVSAPMIESAADSSWYGHVYDRIFPIATELGWTFIHRTARAFLTDTKTGREILGFDTTSDFFITCRLMYARLANLALFARSDTFLSQWTNFLGFILRRWAHIGGELSHHWNRIVAICEQLADSGRLLPGFGNFRYRISGTRFLIILARESLDADNGLLISRIKNRSLSGDEKSSFLLSSTGLPRGRRVDSIQSLCRTCYEILRAGADPNWKGRFEGGDILDSKTGAYGVLQTPWQQLLVSSVRLLLRGMSLTELNSLAELLLHFVSEGAKLSDPVILAFSQYFELVTQYEETSYGFKVAHLVWIKNETTQDLEEWYLMDLNWQATYECAMLTSIPAYMIVKLLTNILRASCSTLDKGSCPKVYVDLENACEIYRSSGTCRAFGKSESDRSEKYFAWWETTDDMQRRLGSKLIELLKVQILLSTPAIEGADGSEGRISDTEQALQCIWDDESWTLRTEGTEMGSVCKRLQELGVMTSLDGVFEFHSQEDWVRKYNLENPQYGGTT